MQVIACLVSIGRGRVQRASDVAEPTACVFFCFVLGCSPPRPCSNPHGREAISVRDLWNALPPPADVEEPLAYPHWRKALPCKPEVKRFCQLAECIYLGFWLLNITFIPHLFLLVSVKNATCTSVTRVSWGCICGKSTAPSLTPRSSTACRRQICPLTWQRHAERGDGGGAKLCGGNLNLGI